MNSELTKIISTLTDYAEIREGVLEVDRVRFRRAAEMISSFSAKNEIFSKAVAELQKKLSEAQLYAVYPHSDAISSAIIMLADLSEMIVKLSAKK